MPILSRSWKAEGPTSIEKILAFFAFLLFALGAFYLGDYFGKLFFMIGASLLVLSILVYFCVASDDSNNVTVMDRSDGSVSIILLDDNNKNENFSRSSFQQQQNETWKKQKRISNKCFKIKNI